MLPINDELDRLMNMMPNQGEPPPSDPPGSGDDDDEHEEK